MNKKQFEAFVVIGCLVGGFVLMLIALVGPYVYSRIMASVFQYCDIYKLGF